jgi:CRISPR-associated protein (Cas_Cmr5)
MTTRPVDLSQCRAEYALERVDAWRRPQEAVKIVKGLPVAVRTVGLPQAVAMLARRGGASRDLSDDLCGWLLARAPMKVLGAGRSDAVGLMERIVASPPEAVRAAEAEAIRFLEVLKLLAELKHG